ncbi:MAG: hypothetical protein ABIE07_01215 [Candidatus Zixiibacteriota bacterium]
MKKMLLIVMIMVMLFLTTILYLIIGGSGNSSTLSNCSVNLNYDGALGRSTMGMQDGGYVIATSAMMVETGDSDMLLLQLDSLGSEIRQMPIGSSLNETGLYITPTFGSGYVIAGLVERPGWHDNPGVRTHNIYMVALDSTLDLLWETTFYFQHIASVVTTSDGGYVIAGNNVLDDRKQVFLIKVDSLGRTVWDKLLAPRGWESCKSMILIPGGYFVLTGWAFSLENTSADIYLAKADSSGNLLWKKYYSMTDSTSGHGLNIKDYEVGWSVSSTPDAGFIITGHRGTVETGIDSRDLRANDDLIIVKTDSLGLVVWERAYNLNIGQRGYSVIPDYNGGYAVAGITRANNEIDEDILVVKIDESGTLIWTKVFEDPGSEKVQCILQAINGDYFITVTGASDKIANMGKYMIRIDPDAE